MKNKMWWKHTEDRYRSLSKSKNKIDAEIHTALFTLHKLNKYFLLNQRSTTTKHTTLPSFRNIRREMVKIFTRLKSEGYNKSSPIRQCLQDGGHQHPRDGLVEDGVTNTHYVHHRGGAEYREHVGRHALPEVQQEALDLHTDTTGYYLVAYIQKTRFDVQNGWKQKKACLIKVGSNNSVQYPLTVRSVHHDEGWHLWATTEY